MEPSTYPPAPQQVPYALDVKPRGSSVLDKMKSSCSKNPSVAIAVIVALVVLAIYLFAQLRGWIGDAPEQRKAAKPAKKSPSKSSGRAGKARAPPEEDDEVDDLIAALNDE